MVLSEGKPSEVVTCSIYSERWFAIPTLPFSSGAIGWKPHLTSSTSMQCRNVYGDLPLDVLD